MVVEIENFYGCYLLVSANIKFKGWTYIGFTVDPNRRINQHNIGRQKGGAWKTSGKGPWDMVLIIHGFPNMVHALQFEWAWQHPLKSLKLKEVCEPYKKLTGFKHKFAIVSEMLRVGPWNRLPLTIRWLNQDFVKEFPAHLQPPKHMSIAYGPVKSRSAKQELKSSNHVSTTDCGSCSLCHQLIKEDVLLRCLNPECDMRCHQVCLADAFLLQEGVTGMLLPVEGDCIKCHKNLLWGDLIRQQTGCTECDIQKQVEDEAMDTADHWSQALAQT
ncbi:structure-specific endonuclease subunit slx1-like [Watersipora subatra]|uniref:structure-specific endonuclease subunit slx1-like n=1 Tax=Watersipora subatra TaxID=2589382 RepID=UPI00355BACAA